MENRLIEAMQRMGFSKNEISTYLTLLNSTTCSAGEIAKKTRMQRRQAYDELDKLLEKGLATYTIREGKKYYQTTNPERLLDGIKENEEILTEAMPELIEKFNTRKPTIHSEVYEGKEALKKIFEDIIKTKQTWYSIGATGTGYILFPIYLEQLAKRRVREGIERKILLANTPRGKEYYKKYKTQKLAEIRFLPKEIDNPQTIWIYGNKIITLLVSDQYPVAVLIENETIAKSYKGYFEILWKNSIKPEKINS
ncbi:MAG: helix-turn-helix domain-containing protein [archaeon]|jgi:sugar-specific transcriptional regulator TrmB